MYKTAFAGLFFTDGVYFVAEPGDGGSWTGCKGHQPVHWCVTLALDPA